MGLESSHVQKDDAPKRPVGRPKHVQARENNTREGRKLVAAKLQEEESGVLQKFAQLGGGKMKRVIGGFMLGSTLLFGAGAFAQMSAGEQMQKEHRFEQTAETRGAILLKSLGELPDNPRATSPKHNEILKKQAAKDMLIQYLKQGGTIEALKAEMANPNFKLGGPGLEKLLEFLKQHR